MPYFTCKNNTNDWLCSVFDRKIKHCPKVGCKDSMHLVTFLSRSMAFSITLLKYEPKVSSMYWLRICSLKQFLSLYLYYYIVTEDDKIHNSQPTSGPEPSTLYISVDLQCQGYWVRFDTDSPSAQSGISDFCWLTRLAMLNINIVVFSLFLLDFFNFLICSIEMMSGVLLLVLDKIGSELYRLYRKSFEKLNEIFNHIWQVKWPLDPPHNGNMAVWQTSQARYYTNQTDTRVMIHCIYFFIRKTQCRGMYRVLSPYILSRK